MAIPVPRPPAPSLSTPDGEVVDEATELLGIVSNNVAEYRALLLGLQRARELGATEVEAVNDSELIAKQVNGQYKVKHADMKPLHAEALAALQARSTAGPCAPCAASRTRTPTRS